MRILGASGAVGGVVVRFAAERGRPVTAAARGEVVPSALGVQRKAPQHPRSALASPLHLTEVTARRVVAAMGESASGLNRRTRPMIQSTKIEANYRHHEWVNAACRPRGLDGGRVRPTRLKEGLATGSVTPILDAPFTASSSSADAAKRMVEHLETKLGDPQTPTITEARS